MLLFLLNCFQRDVLPFGPFNRTTVGGAEGGVRVGGGAWSEQHSFQSNLSRVPDQYRGAAVLPGAAHDLRSIKGERVALVGL